MEIKIFSNNKIDIPTEFWILVGMGIFALLLLWGFSLLK
jgi:hypothetical protein